MSANEAPIKLSLPLAYQQKLFQELRSEDELVVLARGLGLMRLVTNLLHSYDASGNNLVLVVGADERENAWMGEALAEHAALSMASLARGLTVVNTDLTTVGAREKMYTAGGMFSVTSRILVVDLLTGLLNAETITGMMVLHADRVQATSLEAFIIRVYRQKNKVGFLKAFSDNPDPFTMGFAPLSTMMRNLFLGKVSLWPRFHVAVAESLEGKQKAEVIELEVPMTDAMQTIQTAVMECVEISIQELKKGNSGLDMEAWNLDHALHQNFDQTIRRQLEPNWHRVSYKTRQIVSDLTVLRGLLHNILLFDAVSFLQHLDTIHAAHSPAPGSTRRNQSPWLFLDATQTIFETARKRVYAAAPMSSHDPRSMEALQPVLEEQPKWAVLSQILEEIDQDMLRRPHVADDSTGSVLIMCSDTDTCRQLRDYLQTKHVRPQTGSTEKTGPTSIDVDGEEKEEEDETFSVESSGAFMMRRKLRTYLQWKKQFARINSELFSTNQRALTSAVDSITGQYRSKAMIHKRRRLRGGGSMMNTHQCRAENGSIKQFFESATDMAQLMQGVQPTKEEEVVEERVGVVVDTLENMDDYYRLFEMKDLVTIHAYDRDADDYVLEEVKPRYIVMYEPDASFIRRVEVYRSSHVQREVRVYFLYYGESVEEQRYLSSVRREKDAFTKMIKERASMSLRIHDDPSGSVSGDDPQEAFLRTINTRIAGGGRLTTVSTDPPRIIVDIREFRSSLPSLLHGRSMVIVPCMLTVGDYVLSPSICVERKSISDLISSFKDGRLFTQAESMFQHYKDAMLLIEFDQNKSFTLEPFADLSGSLQSIAPTNLSSDLQSKITLLTLAFPRLRIIWSSSPYQTAEIFATLKSSEPEPDPVAAVRAGLTGDVRAEDMVFNQEPQDMLRSVPGVTAQNLPMLTRNVDNIRALANARRQDLDPLVGREASRKIHDFFRNNLTGYEMDDDSDGP